MVGKILIVDDVATNRIVLKGKLMAACYQPLMAADGATCLRMAATELPDLILLDYCLPDMSGIEVLQALRAMDGLRDIPVIVVSAAVSPETRLRALQAGADDVLAKPVDDQLLLARLRSFLRAQEARTELGTHPPLPIFGMAEATASFLLPGTIALVIDRIDLAIMLRRDLSRILADHVTIMTREEALAETAVVPDVYFIDANLGGAGRGLRLMSDLRSRMASRHAEICIMRQGCTSETAAMIYDLGANDLVDPAIPARELAIRLGRLMRRKHADDQLRASVQDGLRLAVIDPLTGLFNRRYALAQLAAIAERASETASDFAVMAVDLDRFKLVNDRHGHAAGDAVLVEVAQRLSVNLREHDLLARIGGEEFLIALPDTTPDEAHITAERLRCVVQEQPIALPGGGSMSVTVSIGLAFGRDARPGPPETLAALIDRADQALLKSKSSGRNTVTTSRTAA